MSDDEVDVSEFLDIDYRVAVQTRMRDGRMRVARLVIEADDVDTNMLRGVPLGRILAFLQAPAGATFKILPRPDGSDPDAFYRAVAETYNATIPHSHRPAHVIAEASEVPVGTAHRWIAEARRRGFLPPGKKGAAG